MQYAATLTVRVLGTMLLTHEYDHKDICVMGYPQEARGLSVDTLTVMLNAGDVIIPSYHLGFQQ